MYNSLTLSKMEPPAMLCKRIGMMLSMLMVVMSFTLATMPSAYAGDAKPAGEAVGLGKIAQNLTNTLPAFVNLIIAGCYVAGLALAGAAILKFKAHKDNPTQVPLGTPIALLFIGAALLWLPSIITSTGESLLGSETDQKALSGPGLNTGGWGSSSTKPAP